MHYIYLMHLFLYVFLNDYFMMLNVLLNVFWVQIISPTLLICQSRCYTLRAKTFLVLAEKKVLNLHKKKNLDKKKFFEVVFLFHSLQITDTTGPL